MRFPLHADVAPVPCRRCGSAPELLHIPRGFMFACPRRNRTPGRSSFHPLYGCPGNNARNYCLTEAAAVLAWNRVQAQKRAITTRDDWNFPDPTPCPRCGLRGAHCCLLGDAEARIPNPQPASGRIRL